MTGLCLDQDGMIVPIDGVLAGRYVQPWVGEDKSHSRAVENRRVMEGFSELGERFAGFEYYSTGVVLRFLIGVYGEL